MIKKINIKKINKIIDIYSRFVTNRPFIILIFAALISISAIQLSGTIQTKGSEPRDFLPKDMEAINTLTTIEGEFGSTNMAYFVIELDSQYKGLQYKGSQYKGSNEVSDIRDPRVIRYMEIISTLAFHTQDVIDVTSPSSILKNINNGRLPQSLRDIQELSNKNAIFDGYINKDYSLAIVQIRTTDDVEISNLETELGKIITQIEKPPGIKTNLGGSIMEDQVMEKSIGPDMTKTSIYSFIGISIIILALFRSIKYGFIPLTTIIFGSIWALGYVGLIGMGMSPETSGVLSMIMGIGIDFGIQVTTRYRFELPGKSPKEAMTVSLNNVIIPMLTTTLAALIGFQAMSLGKLTFLADMGTMMSYGVAASMVAAITVVPALIIIFDTIDISLFKKLIERIIY